MKKTSLQLLREFIKDKIKNYKDLYTYHKLKQLPGFNKKGCFLNFIEVKTDKAFIVDKISKFYRNNPKIINNSIIKVKRKINNEEKFIYIGIHENQIKYTSCKIFVARDLKAIKYLINSWC